ncbi:hypothetical protein [Sphingomonas sp.]|uniref:hypothetical protein n=1 Tax=Sphingomonas sp. TaxID=28214 RepID=UPI003B007966
MRRGVPVLVLLAGVALAIAVLLAAPRAAAVGWLAGFVIAGAVPLGATAWLLIARLTGGEWAAPLLPLARVTPWLLVAGLPLAVASLALAPPPHLRVYLSPPLLIARDHAAVALLAWAGRRVERLSVTAAALLLVTYALIVTMLGCDWLLVVEPGHSATVAGMLLAVVQLLGGLGAALLLGTGAHAARADLAKLLVACALALVYMLYVDWLIVWYGNLPEHVGWYVDRLRGGWIVVPFVGASALPATIWAAATDRLRLAGGIALAGMAIGMGWWIGAPDGWPMAVGAVGGAAAATGLMTFGRRREAVRRG